MSIAKNIQCFSQKKINGFQAKIINKKVSFINISEMLAKQFLVRKKVYPKNCSE